MDFTVFSLENVWIVLFLLAVLVQLYVYLRYFLPFYLYQEVGVLKKKQPKMSIIIAVKNEAENLKRSLPILISQDYPNYELVIVDDHSTDETAEILKNIKFPKIQLHQMNEKSGKKAAIQKGIENATGERFLFLDADCRPRTTYWLRLMSEKLVDVRSIVLGYAPYYKEKTFLNKVIRYETFVTGMQYLSAALIGKPYMGVGRNLAYTRKVYEESTAFENHADVLSGDDDLIVNEMSDRAIVTICTQMEAHSLSLAVDSWEKLYHQKRRHLQAGKYYKRKDRWKLGIFAMSQLLFWVCFISFLISSSLSLTLILIFSGKILLQLFLYNGIMRKLDERDLLMYAPLLEIVYLLFMGFIGVSTKIKKVDRWK